MKPLFLLLCTLAAGLSQAQVPLGTHSTLTFATVAQAREILTRRDDFIRALSPFDRAVRMKSGKDVSEADFLAFVGEHNLEWTDAEKEKISTALEPLQEKFKTLALPFPKTVLLIKTTGGEDSNSPYTRSHAIILPQATIAKPVDEFRKVLIHELFHILSRANPTLRDRLYAAIGFVKCEEAEYPAELKPVKLTNPDAPSNTHCISLKHAGQDIWAIPILYSRTNRYDTTTHRSLFTYLQPRLLAVAHDPANPAAKPSFTGKDTKILRLEETTGFYEQVGQNTKYIIHPEEIVADNFGLLISGGKAASPDVLQKIEAVLKPKRPSN